MIPKKLGQNQRKLYGLLNQSWKVDESYGNPIEQNHIRRIFKRVLTKAGIREIRIHDIRHTYASLLLSQDEIPVYVKEQLGHQSIYITVDIYGHLIPSSNRAAVNRLDSPQPSATHSQPAQTENP